MHHPGMAVRNKLVNRILCALSLSSLVCSQFTSTWVEPQLLDDNAMNEPVNWLMDTKLVNSRPIESFTRCTSGIVAMLKQVASTMLRLHCCKRLVSSSDRLQFLIGPISVANQIELLCDNDMVICATRSPSTRHLIVIYLLLSNVSLLFSTFFAPFDIIFI